MTREEFTKGWVFLTVQPWGSIYDGRLEPDKARVQFELYYERLGYANPKAWEQTAKLFAAGNQWPNMDVVSQSLSQRNKSYVASLPNYSRKPEPDPDPDPETQEKVEATLSRIIGKPFKLPD